MNLDEKILRRWFGVGLVLKTRADIIQGWMKSNAPWKDRTGMARQSLKCTVEIGDRQIVMRFAHGVDYGKYLEHKYAGKYAILRPAIEQFREEIKKDVKDVLEGVR